MLATALLSSLLIRPNIPLGRNIFALIARRRDWEKGYIPGVISYWLALFTASLVFPGSPIYVSLIWIVLAFGDGFSGLVGQVTRWGPPLPWSPRKRLVGLIIFLLGALIPVWLLGSAGIHDAERVRTVGAMLVFVAAILESLPLQIEDNILIGAGGITFLLLAG